MKDIGAGVSELRIHEASGEYRVIYIAKLKDANHVLHCFEKNPKKPLVQTSISRKRGLKPYSEDDLAVSGPVLNIFEALEDDPQEAARLAILADLSITLEMRIRQEGWTQKE